MDKHIYHAKDDPKYRAPYVDIEETRSRTLSNGKSVPYRYVHGGFADTNVKFSFCFPEKKSYRGRFYQYLSPFPGPDEEMASLNKTGEDDIIAFCLENGAYYVETNMGSSAQFDGSGDNTRVFKSSAAAAEFSRIKAMEYYGCGRPYGYVFGGSGGGYKTMACIENTDAWDGAVPYVIGSPVSLPNTITMHVQGQRCLRNAFGKIIDALDAGGSGNPYAELNPEETAMLKELTAMGFHPMIWYREADGQFDDGALPVLTPDVKRIDPSYFRDFWETPGYEGTNPDSIAYRDRLQFRGVVRAAGVQGQKELLREIDDRNGVDTAWQKALSDGTGAWIQLEEVPQGKDLYLRGVNITIQTGSSAGKQLLLRDIVGNCLTIGMCYGVDDPAKVIAGIQPGDVVTLDNSDYIAIQHYYRHQVPADRDFHAWDQFRDENGNPAIPQRAKVMGYGFNGTGTVQDGCIQGKVIVVQALMDESTCPWCADWYRKTVAKAQGSEENFRLYYIDRCMHGDVTWMENNMVTNYLGAHRQALLDISDWVERGIEPLQTTVYEYRDGQIYPAPSAKERKGVQPVVELLANGSACAHVKVGEAVHFEAKAVVPEGAGQVTAIDFGFSDNRKLPGGMDADYPVKAEVVPFVDGGLNGASASVAYTYDKPGTYFAAVRVKSNRDGDAEKIFTQVKNLARARVVVEE